MPTDRKAGLDEKPAPLVPEPLFPMLRRLTGEDVQRARSWLLAWLLDRLGQRVQEPPPPAYNVQRQIDGKWVTVMGPFYRQWVARQLAENAFETNRRWHYRVVGPSGVVPPGDLASAVEESPHGD